MKPCAFCQDGQPANCECTPETATPFIIDDYIRQLTADRDKWRAMAEELAEELAECLEVLGRIIDNLNTLERAVLEKFNQLKNQ